MSLKKDFKEFLFRGNIVDLAVGVIIGAAFGKIAGAFGIVTAAAKRCKFCTSALTVALLGLFVGFPGLVHAQEPTPEFKFEKAAAPIKEETEAPAEKKLQARGGLVNLSGNSRASTGTVGTTASYQKGKNRVSADGTIAWARSSALIPQDNNGNKFIENDSELGSDERATSELFAAKGRFDRFVTENNSAYASLQMLRDEPAGKAIVAGGQVGYSRLLLKNATHRMVAELGYDFAYEKATADGAQAVQVHSARLFVAEELKLTESTGAFLNLEALANLNEEKSPATGYAGAKALEDMRFFGKAGITTTIWKNLSFAFTVGLRYDSAPAPLKEPKGVKFWNGDAASTTDPELAAKPAYRPQAEKLDTLTEATLVVTFL